MDQITLRLFIPEDAPWIAESHGALYQRDDGFDETFQPLVESILADFVADHDPIRERGWVATQSNRRVGCIFCTKLNETTAKLRLFLILPEMRGQGVGQRLLNECISFARDSGYEGMQLWTHESHRAACALYARNGWQILRSEPVHSFGRDLVELTWAIRFDP